MANDNPMTPPPLKRFALTIEADGLDLVVTASPLDDGPWTPYADAAKVVERLKVLEEALKWYAGEGTGEPGEYSIVHATSGTVVNDFSTFGGRAQAALAPEDAKDD